MSRLVCRPGWYPLAKTSALRHGSLQKWLAGTELVLAPGGACERVTGAPRAARIGPDWIYVWQGSGPPDDDPPADLVTCPKHHLTLDGVVRASLGDVGENILDTTHTSVVHAGYLRRPGRARRVEACIESGNGWIRATYPPDAAPRGWAARLIGAGSYTIQDAFRAPSIAEVVYSGDNGPVFAGRFHLTPVTATETYIAVTLAVPGSGLLTRAKLAALQVFFRRILAEDRAILELISINRLPHGAAPVVYAPQDVLRPGIDAILDGREIRFGASTAYLKV